MSKHIKKKITNERHNAIPTYRNNERHKYINKEINSEQTTKNITNEIPKHT